jgi:hypothetical protein
MKMLFTVLVVLTGLLYLVLLTSLAGMHALDPAGRALSDAYGVLLAIGLWGLLAGMLAAARTKGAFPSFSGWAVLILLPASLSAMLATLSVFTSPLSPRWLLVPAVVPPFVLALFAVALWFPTQRLRVQSFRVNCAIWGSILLLSALPWLHVVKPSTEKAGYVEERETHADPAPNDLAPATEHPSPYLFE